MSKRARRETFADIVREVASAPAPLSRDHSGAVDTSGTRWQKHVPEISPAQALKLAQEGASIAWDRCGCGGYCGFDWFGPEDVAHMIAAGQPTVRSTKRHRGNLSEWTAEDGRVLVVAEDAVRWGDVID